MARWISYVCGMWHVVWSKTCWISFVSCIRHLEHHGCAVYGTLNIICVLNMRRWLFCVCCIWHVENFVCVVCDKLNNMCVWYVILIMTHWISFLCGISLVKYHVCVVYDSYLMDESQEWGHIQHTHDMPHEWLMNEPHKRDSWVSRIVRVTCVMLTCVLQMTHSIWLVDESLSCIGHMTLSKWVIWLTLGIFNVSHQARNKQPHADQIHPYPRSNSLLPQIHPPSRFTPPPDSPPAQEILQYYCVCL